MNTIVAAAKGVISYFILRYVILYTEGAKIQYKANLSVWRVFVIFSSFFDKNYHFSRKK